MHFSTAGQVVPRTLSQMFRVAALAETRPAAVLRRTVAGWRPVSEARLFRRVERLALYLQNIFGIGPGDRVAIASELRPEWLLADVAVLTLGAVSVAVEPDLPPGLLAAAIRDSAPRFLLASPRVLSGLQLVHGHLAPLIPVMALDGATCRCGPVGLASALHVGGALETPARIGRLRSRAWDTDPGSAALCHYAGYLDGHTECIELSHAEACREALSGWSQPYARAGEVIYVVGPVVTLRSRLALYAALGDGLSAIAFATPGQEFEELADLRPGKVVGPPSFLAQALHVGQVAPSLAALGGRVRWIGPSAPLEPELAARLRALTAVRPVPGRPPGRRSRD